MNGLLKKFPILLAVWLAAASCTQTQQPQSQEAVKVVTWRAAEVTNTSAVLSGRYSGVTTEVRDHGFYWGTSESSMTEQLGLNSSSDQTADFTATLSSLEPGKTYFFKAYVTVMDSASGKYVDVEGGVQSFTTTGGDNPGPGPGSGDNSQPVSGLQYLGGYEIPAISLLKTDSSSGSGKDSDGPWFNYKTTDENQMVVTHAYSYNGKQYRNWTAMIDGTKKAPIWSAFVMHDDAYPDKNAGRSNNWRNDPAIPSGWQQSGISGYSKGHLVASNYRQTSDNANRQTFYYTNQAPQYQTQFNDGVWNNLEQAVKSHAPSDRDTLYVVVGLLYENDKVVSSVPVPSHFYKLLMKCSFNTSGEMSAAKGCAYIFTNEAHPKMNYSEGITSIDAIEQRTGFNFFANVPAELQDDAESSSKPIW